MKRTCSLKARRNSNLNNFPKFKYFSSRDVVVSSVLLEHNIPLNIKRIINMNIKCEYGCDRDAEYKFGNGKACCSSHYLKCPNMRKNRVGVKNPFFGKKHTTETLEKISKSGSDNPMFGRKHSPKTIYKIKEGLIGKNIGKDNHFYGKKHTDESKRKMSDKLRYSIEDYKKRYPIFFAEEKMRNNESDEIEFRCKQCFKWFTPTRPQIYERIRALETKDGHGGNYLYCSDSCKDKCPVFNFRGSYKTTLEHETECYLPGELKTWRDEVMKRDGHICALCGSDKNLHVHHIKPVKLEPFFALDPDYGLTLCQTCHLSKIHRNGCSTIRISKQMEDK